MAYTVRTLIEDALSELGVLPQASSPQPWQYQKALRTLNLWIDAKKADSFFVYNTTRQLFPFVSGQGSYTYGPGGDFSTENRNLVQASVQVNSSGQLQEFMMGYLSVGDWQMVTAKEIVSSWPQYFYLDNAWPLRTLNVWPVPTYTSDIVLYCEENVEEFTSLDTVIELPFGYKYALVNNLAVILAPQYQIQPDAVLVGKAINSLSNIERSNMKPQFQYADPMFNQGGSSVARWNILTNTYSASALGR